MHNSLYQATPLLKSDKPKNHGPSYLSHIFQSSYVNGSFNGHALPGLVARSHGVLLPIAVGCGQGGAHIVQVGTLPSDAYWVGE